MRSWIIGSAADCDLVITRPTVSGRHCRLTETAVGYLLEDLGSSNGTYVNGVRLTSPARISASDAVTLGLAVPMPWPEPERPPVPTVTRIGRLGDNDVVLDDPRVSGHHARLIVEGSRARIEDLGSSNGTFLNSPDRRITQAVPITGADTIYFGSLAIPAARLLPARPTAEATANRPIAPPSPAAEPPVFLGPIPSSASAPTTAPGFDRLWAIILLAEAPVLAILVVLIFGRHVGAADADSAAQGLAATAFALGVAAIGLGASLAVWASVVGGPDRVREDSLEARLLASPGSRIVTLIILCALQCAVLLTIVHLGSGLKGDWLAMFGVLVLGAGVGLLIGLVVSALSRSPAIVAGVLFLSLLPMIALGGWIRPLTDLWPAVRPVAAAMPSRWAFEGLLLLESDRRPPPEAAGPKSNPDLGEDRFPAETERMGVTADAMALGSMLIGLTTLLAFLSLAPKYRSPQIRTGNPTRPSRQAASLRPGTWP
jgi:pSer/pThr/pTyr-binding forkhead associated (FHA) protein